MNRLIKINKQVFALLLFVTVGCNKDDTNGDSFKKPVITEISPSAAIIGTEVTITGSNLNEVKSVKFGGVTASTFSATSNSIKATVPEGLKAGTVDLSVFYAGASDNNMGASDRMSFLVLYPPAITTVDPTSGKPGATIVLTGEYLTATSSVKFGDVDVEFLATEKTIEVHVPDINPGDVQLSVTTPAGTAEVSFIIIEQLPEIQSINPGTGAAGTEITLSGLKLADIETIKIGTTAVDDFTIVDAETITFVVPDGASSGKIFVTSSKGTFSSTGVFVVPNNSFKLVVFDEIVNSNWQKWGGWGTAEQDLENSEHPKGGSVAFKVAYNDAYGAIQMHPTTPSPFLLADYTSVKISLYGAAGSEGKQVSLYIKDSGGVEHTKVQLTLKEGSYTSYEVSLSSLGNPADIAELNIQNWGTVITIYIDDWGLN